MKNSELAIGVLIHMRSQLISQLSAKMAELLHARRLLIDSLNLPRHYLNKKQSFDKYIAAIESDREALESLVKYATKCNILDGVAEQGALDNWIKHIDDKTTREPPISPHFKDVDNFNEFAEGFASILKQNFNSYNKFLSPDVEIETAELPPLQDTLVITPEE